MESKSFKKIRNSFRSSGMDTLSQKKMYVGLTKSMLFKAFIFRFTEIKFKILDKYNKIKNFEVDKNECPCLEFLFGRLTFAHFKHE